MSKQQPFLRSLTVFAALASLAVWGVASGPWSAPSAPTVPSGPATSAANGAVRAVLHVQPFRLAAPYTHNWRAERPSVTAGFLVVLDVDPAVFTASQGLEPVLQFGAETVQRVNQGQLDGRLIGLVPALAGADGWPLGDLSDVAPFLAAAALPEQVQALAAQQSWNVARSEALAAHADRALPLAQGLDLASYNDLLREAAGLILEHAPGERELAQTLLIPVLR